MGGYPRGLSLVSASLPHRTNHGPRCHPFWREWHSGVLQGGEGTGAGVQSRATRPCLPFQACSWPS